LKAVLVHLLGGLGNQMFRYAAARAVAVHCKAPLVVSAGAGAGAGRGKLSFSSV
jgi:hypothetical protein